MGSVSNLKDAVTFLFEHTFQADHSNSLEEGSESNVSDLDQQMIVDILVKEKAVSRSQAELIIKEWEAEITSLRNSDLTPQLAYQLVNARLIEHNLGEIGQPVPPDPGEIEESEKELKKNTLQLSDNALKVLRKRYLKKDENGQPTEEPEDMFYRVANTIAGIDARYNPRANVMETTRKFYNMMASMEFLPNSPTLMNAGRELGQLSACFVLPVGDSMDSIFEAVKNTALIHKSGGGTGFSFSQIRPKNDFVKSTRGISSGPISFMKVFDVATETIKQGGTRRGANMGILRIDHPDIMEFISCKEDDHTLTNFNISVGITEAFMKALEEDGEYVLINPHSERATGRLRAKEVFDTIVQLAWKNGDPGIIFLDRINRDNPTPHLGEIESTNPCGEQPLLSFESCNLGSINLSKVVTGREIDFEKLGRTVDQSVHFLDNVIDANKYPLPEIEEMTRGNRKIGLGVMGFADMLIKLDIPYNSEEALKVAEKVMSFISRRSMEASAKLAGNRAAFENFKGSIYDSNNGKQMVVRNATTTTIAPTGTISIIANCSSGIEPLFAVSYSRRNVLDDDEMIEVNPQFETEAKKVGIYNKKLMERITECGTVADLEEIPGELRRIFVTAHDISPEWHIRMQAAFQQHTHNAVSKTVNFPESATTDDIRKVYLMAYYQGCKGVTIYRDRSRDQQVLNIDTSQTTITNQHEMKITRFRPSVTIGRTEKIGTGCGNFYITINEDEYGLCEVFSHLGKSGGCAASQLEAISRLISLSLRAGVEVDMILKQLRGIRCPSPRRQSGGMVLSCADAIGIAIERYMKNQDTEDFSESDETDPVPAKGYRTEAGANIKIKDFAGVCPECGNMLVFQEGCFVCQGCGHTKC